MSRLARRVPAKTFTFSRNQRIAITALVSVLALGGIAISNSAALRQRLGLSAGSKHATPGQFTLPRATRNKTDPHRTLGDRASRTPLSAAVPVAPSVSATKTDTLFTDVDGDLQADPGDTLKYTINITASGGDATGVNFTDTVDPNTAFVAGTLRATPVAVDDTYAATGNVRISIAAPGVLGNDFAGLPSATISGAPVTSANGGDVTLNADGSFTYNPPAGFEGTDTFSYTLTNSEGSNPASVTINVSGMIWFINNTASCPCDGRLTNPFNTLASFQAVNNGAGNNPAANDNIFVYESAADYVGPVTLLNGQRFLGQDSTASLSAMTGLTPPAGSDPLPATNSGNGTIVNITAGNAITVASGNTLRGFTGGNSTTDITGTGFGTLTISDVTLNGSGQALNLNTGTLAATFGSISSTNSATTGISLTGVAGSLTTPTTTITNPTGIGISVGTASATLSFGNTTSSLSGGAGVSLLTNSGTITFGALDISPDANQRGLLATDNSNTLASTSGTISTSSATAVEITRSSSTTPLSMTLTSVTSTGGTANGITLQNTSGSFTVAGNGGTCTTAGTCTGGNIANKTGADGNTQGTGIFVNNASNVSITRMKLNDFSNYAIRGTNVTAFTMNNCFVDGVNGDNAVNGEGTIIFDGLFGSSSFSGDTIKGGIQDNFRVINTSGTGAVTIDSCTIRDTSTTSTGNDNLNLRTSGSAGITAYVTNNTFAATNGDHLQTIASEQSSMTIVATDNNLSGGGGASALGQGITISGGNATPVDSTETVRFNISNNTMTGTIQGGAININQGSGNGNWQGQVVGNTIGNAGVQCSGASQSSGVRLENHSKGVMIGIVNSNTIRQTCGAGGGMSVTAGDNTASGLGNGPLNATVFNNSVIVPSGLGSPFNDDHGIVMVAGNLSGNTNQVCVDFKNNTAQGNTAVGSSGQGFRIRQRFSTTVFLPGYAGAATNTAAVRTYILGRPNTASGDPSTANNGDVSVTVQSPPGGGFVNGGAQCTQPIVPTVPLPPPAAEFVGSSAMSAEGAGASSDVNSGTAPETEDILQTTQGESPARSYARKVSPAELSALMPAAIERWRATGISIDDLMRLQSVTFEITDLPEGQLASAASTGVKIDQNAGGYGWYVDPTPMDDSEFDVAVPDRELQTTEFSPAFGRMDLFTVVMRELGVAYRQGKKSLPKQLRSLMENTLSPDVRRIPDSRSIGLPAKSKANTGGLKMISQTRPVSKPAASIWKAGSRPATGSATGQGNRLRNHVSRNMTRAASLSNTLADVMLSIGTLPAGESVTITFNVTVNDPFTGAMPQVSNQGTVSGTNFSDVLTDDPSVGGTADPTVTPIDLPQVTLAVSPASVLEDGATNLVYTFSRTGPTANPMTVNFNVGGTASFTQPDYSQSGAATFTATNGTVVIPSGSSTATVTVDPSADTTVEPDETVMLTVTSGTGYTVGSPSGATGTIVNDDTDVSVAVSPASVAEDGAANLVYTFARVGVTTNALTVNFSIAVGGNNAAFPGDYTQSGASTFAPPVGTVTFSPGSSTATVTVDPTADPIVEPDETVIFTITSGSGYNVGSPSAATGTITNDDADVSVTVTPSSVTEDGPTNLVYTFTRTGFTAVPVTVNFSVGGTAVFSQPDYTQTGAATYSDTSGTVVFGVGQATATVTIDPSADLTVEPDETVVLTVTPGTGYNVGSPDSATGTITNDDTDVSVAVSPASVAEDGATNLVYTFTRTGVTGSALTVNFSVGGTANFGASPNDYTETGATTFTATSGSVTFAPGSSTATVTVNPETDSTVEPDETVDLTVTSGSGYSIGSPSSASGTIANDDTDVSVAVSPASVAEDGATNLVYMFTRNGVTSGALTVNFSVGGTANFGASPNDYTQTGATSFTSTSGSVTFAPGNSTATITVNPEADATIEPDETVILTLTSGAGYNVSSPFSATGTITNDDADVSVAVSPASVTEDGATNLVYTFTRTGFTAGGLTVNFSVGGTATFGPSPDDYTQTGATTFTTTSGSVTFAPGNSTATVTVDPETDTTPEPDETVDITLTPGTGYNVVSPSSATGTILNDDTIVTVAVSPTSTAEGGANLVYTFTRTGSTASAVIVDFSVGGSASFPADYSQSGATTFTPPNATVTFDAGSSTATVTVTPLTDCVVEGNETVEFTVQPGAGYGVGSPSMATGTIANTPDSTAPTITMIPNSDQELSPPNHAYHSVAVTDFVASASDDCDPTVNIDSVYILRITSDEVENGNGDGNTLNDIVIAGDCKTAQLRAERSVSGNGRVYTITFKVKDSAGNFTTSTAHVTVRSSPNNPAIDDGPMYTVNSSCP